MRPSIRLTAFLTVIALAGAAVAGCGGSSTKSSNGTAAAAGSVRTATLAAQHLTLVVKSDAEHARKGPDGKWHDAFVPADFSVKAGQRVTVTVNNYDDAQHTFTAPELGVNVVIPGGAATKPGTATFSFTAPAKAGSYQWICAMPCDPWAMAHDGFMRGHVQVTA
jgi:membrane fusion protein, multidrug efflux system